MSEPLSLTTNHFNVVPQSIEWEITQSYIDYSMSVIISRALPDTRDGMKPVIRRILYAMYENKLYHNAKYRKSAKIVWEVLGNYHPHGDASVYEAMVRLSQKRSLRYPLVDGQWNFGSIDGDWPAAQRYTEARLTKIAEEMLEDIELDTVERRSNYDTSRMEPTVLPTKFPNHLCNGTMGIAVGMATNMAPHNLTEVIDASIQLMQHPDMTIDDVMEIVKWPDFPTGGQIFDSTNIKQVYAKGKGSIIVRGKVHTEIHKKTGNTLIIITKIPYQVAKSDLVENIAQLVTDHKVEGILDIVDESAKEAIRVVIELKKWIDVDHTLLMLYKYTRLQTNFSLNNITLVEWCTQPRLLNIKDLLVEFVAFRRVVVYRRSVYQLSKAEDRLHILQGLQKAIDIIDAIIALIRHSQTVSDAKIWLMHEFSFSDSQADYILKLQLSRLVGLEIQKILEEIADKQQLIQELQAIINNPTRLDEVVKEELIIIKEKYGDERRTEIIDDMSIYDMASGFKELKKLQDLKKVDVLCLIDNNYHIKVLYQSRIQVVPEETIEFIKTHNQDKLIVITDIGELVIHRLKDLWEFTTKSEPLNPKKHWKLSGNIVFCSTMDHDYTDLVFLSSHNSLKKIKKELLLKFKKFPTTIMSLENGEKLTSVTHTKAWDKIGVLSKKAMLLLFPESDLRAMGKMSGGVKALELEKSDSVAGLFVYQDEPFIMVYSNLAGKLLSIDDLKIQKRSKKGQIVALLQPGELLKWWAGITEWNLRIKLSNGEIKTIHNDIMKLDDPETPLEPMTQVGIEMVYRPREEKKKKTEEELPTNTLLGSLS